MTNDPIVFRFSSIQIISKKLAPPPEGFTGTVGYSFTILVETKIDEKLKAVSPVVYIKILYGEGEGEKIELASFVVAYYFELADFEKVMLKNDENAYVIPDQLDSLIKPPAISTTRGIIYSELRGTYLHNVVMPIVFMDKFDYGDPPGFK
jgi:hypothetical protein